MMDQQLQNTLNRIESEIKNTREDTIDRLSRLDEQMKWLSRQLETQNERIGRVEERVLDLERTTSAYAEKHDNIDEIDLVKMRSAVDRHTFYIGGLTTLSLGVLGTLIARFFLS